MKYSGLWMQYDEKKNIKRKSSESVQVQKDNARYTVTFTPESAMKDVSVGMTFQMEDWQRDSYIMIPAAVYDGNRFRIHKVTYPPMFTPDMYEKNPEVTVTDIPHLSKDSEGYISLRAGDSSVPAVFIYQKNPGKMTAFLYPCHPEEGMESGVQIHEYEEQGTLHLEVLIAAPIVRSKGMYRFGEIRSDAPCEDPAVSLEAQESLKMWVDVYEEDCEDLAAFYRRAMELSRMPERIAGDYSLPQEVPLAHGFRLVEDKYNRWSWNPKENFYYVGEGQNLYAYWQTGWVGGINAAYPLYCDGSAETQKRALQTMDFMFRVMQAPSGLFYGVSDGTHIYGDDFRNLENKGFTLTRKSADALYYAALILLEVKQREEEAEALWVEGLRRCADGWVRVFEKEGQLGQFLDVDTCEVLIGNTASGGMVPGGLALCAVYFDEPKYLETACKIAEHYYENYTRIGLANGGPGEILAAPDSESAYALVESYVLLYECTRDVKYLAWAEEAAAIYSTWCMPYDYPFPKESTFGIEGMCTTGAVWANVQNKHGAPGPCTHSGSALFRLARYTGKDVYMEICRDTSHNITQYLSREDRPLWNYDHTKTAPSGFMCERVSTCDWEGYDKIGGVYETGCWCEATTMCVYTDIPGIWVDTVRDQVWVSDHVEVDKKGNMLYCTNPTKYEANVKIYVDHGEWQQGDYEYRHKMKQYVIPAGGTCCIRIHETENGISEA